MEQKSLAVLEQPQNVQTQRVLIIEQFLNDNYLFRRNVHRPFHPMKGVREGHFKIH